MCNMLSEEITRKDTDYVLFLNAKTNIYRAIFVLSSTIIGFIKAKSECLQKRKLFFFFFQEINFYNTIRKYIYLD